MAMERDPGARVLRLVVPAARAGQSVERVLRGELRLSNARLKSLKWRGDAIERGGAPVRTNETVCAGDVLTVRLYERRAPSERGGEAGAPLRVVYEDEDLLVISKPAGLPMHDRGGPTLSGALRDYLGGGAAAHFVSRLDRGTSGLLLAAKSGYVHDRLRRMLHTPSLYREYRAVAVGDVRPAAGGIALPIGPDTARFYAYRVCPEGRAARTEFEVLRRGGGLTLLRLVPLTGRTHQLRVHMAALGFPLAGDTLYGAPEQPALSRPALHSCLLRFVHPLTGETLRFTEPLPEDLRRLTEGMRPVTEEKRR